MNKFRFGYFVRKCGMSDIAALIAVLFLAYTPLSDAAGNTAAMVTLQATAGDGKVDLSWTVSGDVRYLQIYRDTDSDAHGRSRKAILSGDKRSYTDSAVVNGQTYWYWVKYTDSNNRSGNSNASSAMPMPKTSGGNCDADPVSGDVYSILNRGSGKVLDVAGANTGNGGNLIQWPYKQSENQQFRLIELGNGYWSIEALHSGRVVDVAGYLTDNGANVHQWEYLSGSNQQWALHRSAASGFNIVSRHSGKSLTVRNAEAGANVYQQDDSAAAFQRWYFNSSDVTCDNANPGDSGSGTTPPVDSNPEPPVEVPANNTGVTSLKSLADFPIGVAVDASGGAKSILNGASSQQQQSVLLPHFDQMTAANIMKMSYLHPSENSFTFDRADQFIDFAHAHGMSVHGHALIWHSDYQVPGFMKNYSGDFAAMLKRHVQTIASHYRGKVVSWDVVNEALAEAGDSSAVNGFRNSLFYRKMGVSYIDEAFINARAADPDADLFYNDFNIENGGAKTDHMLSLIDGLVARGVPITGVGFQMHVLSTWPSVATMESAMRAVADRGLKVKISELYVRVNNQYDASAPVYQRLTAEAAEKQKQRYQQIVAAYLRAVPPAQRAGVTVWGVGDADSWLNTPENPDWPLLFDDNFNAKPALQGFADGLKGG